MNKSKVKKTATGSPILDTSVRAEADPGQQTGDNQNPSGRLPLVAGRPMITYLAADHINPLASNKFTRCYTHTEFLPNSTAASALADIYTVSQNKTRTTQSFCDNSSKYGPISIILSPLHSAMNNGRSFYIICHLTSNLLPYYLVKFECSTEQPFTIVTQFKSVQSSCIGVIFWLTV